MTCAHVVNVALKKVAGVESVDVSLNKGLAIVKLKPGNTVSVSQLWQLIHEKGYTPKTTAVSVRGELMSVSGKPQLKVSGTNEVLVLSGEGSKQAARIVVVHGVMTPGKNLKAPVPLQVSQVE
jgi:copper chaperone CopZ